MAAIGVEKAAYLTSTLKTRLLNDQRLQLDGTLKMDEIISIVSFGLLISYVAFGTGFVPQLTGEYQYNNALFKPSPDSDPALIVDNADIQPEDHASAVWLGKYRQLESPVSADFTSIHLQAYASVPRDERWYPGSGTLGSYDARSPSVPPGGYLYFRTIIYQYDIVPGNYGKAKFNEDELYVDSQPAIHKASADYSKIYATRNTAVFRNM
jgi:hypothetical protein